MRDASVQQSIKSHQFFGEIDSVVAFAGVFFGVCGERLVGLLFPVAAAFLLRGGVLAACVRRALRLYPGNLMKLTGSRALLEGASGFDPYDASRVENMHKQIIMRGLPENRGQPTGSGFKNIAPSSDILSEIYARRALNFNASSVAEHRSEPATLTSGKTA